MEFINESLLNYDDMKIMISSIFPNQKAEIIHKNISDVMFINKKDGNLYVLKKNIVYEKY